MRRLALFDWRGVIVVYPRTSNWDGIVGTNGRSAFRCAGHGCASPIGSRERRKQAGR
jgi:hypothetical protein